MTDICWPSNHRICTGTHIVDTLKTSTKIRKLLWWEFKASSWQKIFLKLNWILLINVTIQDCTKFTLNNLLISFFYSRRAVDSMHIMLFWMCLSILQSCYNNAQVPTLICIIVWCGQVFFVHCKKKTFENSW